MTTIIIQLLYIATISLATIAFFVFIPIEMAPQKKQKHWKNAHISQEKHFLINPECIPEIIRYVLVTFKDNTTIETAVSIPFNSEVNEYIEIRKALNHRYNNTWKHYTAL
jgi:hypothetical protein